MRPFEFSPQPPHALHVKRRTAAAGALHVRILELEACTFQRLTVVNGGAVQVHHRDSIGEDLQDFNIESLMYHALDNHYIHRLIDTCAQALTPTTSKTCTD